MTNNLLGKCARLLAAMTLPLAASAATPLAVWDGADTSLGAFTLTTDNGNTIGADNTITIASGATGGVVYTGANSSLNNCTFIIRCSGLDLANANNQYLLSVHQNMLGGGNGDASYNKVGVSLAANNAAVRGIWNNGFYEDNGTQVRDPLSSGTVLVVNIQTSGGVFVYEILTDADTGARTLVKRYGHTGLKSSNTNYKGFSLGGIYEKASSTLSPATGWKIEKMAVFGSTLSESDILGYAFPSDRVAITATASGATLGAACSGMNVAITGETDGYVEVPSTISVGAVTTDGEPFAIRLADGARLTAASIDATSAAVAIDVSAWDLASLARNAVAGAPYRVWPVSCGSVAGTVTVDLSGATVPTGYAVSAISTTRGPALEFTSSLQFGSLNVNFSGGRGGNTDLDDARVSDYADYSSLMHGAFPVVGTSWNDVAAENASGVSVARYVAQDGTVRTDGGATVTLTGVANPYTTGASPGDRIIYGYCDDSGSPKLVIENVPFAKYRVIVYAATDNGSAFCPKTVNDVSYSTAAAGSAATPTLAGATGAWGDPSSRAELLEGVNYLVSDVIEGTATVTVKNPKTSAGRACLPAVQVVEVGVVRQLVSAAAEIADGGTFEFAGSGWTIDGAAGQSLESLASSAVGTITLDGDATLVMPASVAQAVQDNLSALDVALAPGVSSATLTLAYGHSGTLPSSAAPGTTAALTLSRPSGLVQLSCAAGVSVVETVPSIDAAEYGYAVSGDTVYVARRPEVGVVSVRIGARVENPGGGYINPSYSDVGPYPISGVFWDQTKFWENDSIYGNYTDIQSLTDAKDGGAAVRIGYYGHNTYFNANALSSPNMVLTRTYLDDSPSGSTNLTATASADGETIVLPTPGHERGWQLHFENIPYNAYDVYFITASDVVDGSLKECPIYVSLDGGTTWKSYCGDSANEKTVMGTENWTGLPYAENGVLVEGKNYIKMRITKSIYGDDIGTIDITHGVRNTGNKVRSGLAAIQIVEVLNDGVYTLAESGDWSGAVWSVGGQAGQTWTDTVDGEPSIAKIAPGAGVEYVNVDQDVSAGSVILTGSDPFTVAGASTLSVGTGFDASAFSGSLTLQAPIAGTVYVGAGTDLRFGGDTDMALPAYTLDGAGMWKKVGTGTLVVNNNVTLAGRVDDGDLEVATSYSGSLALNGGNIVLAGPAGEGAEELMFSGTATVAEGCAVTGRTVVASGTVQVTGRIATDIEVGSGAVLKLGSFGGFGATGNGAYASSNTTIVVNSGGTVELNGQEGCNAYVLAGGTLRNTGAAIGTGSRQTMGLTLAADSAVVAASNFGMVNNQYAANTLDLGAYTLAKSGEGSFWLYNTTVAGTGRIAIEEGSVYAYGAVAAAEATFDIGPNGTLKIRTNDFSASGIAGTGTLNVGTARPAAALNFAEESRVAVSIMLAASESEVRIPYTGEPASVTVYEPDGTTVSPYATTTYESGFIVVRVSLADASRVRPATGGATTNSYAYVFTGAEDATWANTANWASVVDNRWTEFTSETAPGLTGSHLWDYILFDGSLMMTSAGADGYKSVTVPSLEGYTLRLGAYNGAKVTISSVVKQQSGCRYMVDETSKIVLGQNARTGNNGGDVKFFVAAPEGVVFTGDFDFGGCGTVSYYLDTKGSVRFAAGASMGTQQLADVYVDFGVDKARTPGWNRGRITRRLVSFGGVDNSALSTSSMVVVATDGATVPNNVGDAALTGAANEPVGSYRVRTEADGVYLDYIGWSPDAVFPHFYISVR